MTRQRRQRRKTIALSAIRAVSEIQCSEKEAAAVLGISERTFREMIRIDAKAREVWETGRELGKASIRRAQFALATRYPQMAIYLGKQYLGQTEVSVIEHSGRDGGPIKTLDLTKLTPQGRQDLRKILQQVRVEPRADGKVDK